MTLFATLTAAMSWVGGCCLYAGCLKKGQRQLAFPQVGQARLGQADLGQESDNRQPRGCGSDGGDVSGDGARSVAQRQEDPVSSVPDRVHYLLGCGGGGQGCSASSCSSCLKRFLEARLGLSHRRQAGRHWSSMLCRGQERYRGGGCGKVREPPNPDLAWAPPPA